MDDNTTLRGKSFHKLASVSGRELPGAPARDGEKSTLKLLARVSFNTS